MELIHLQFVIFLSLIVLLSAKLISWLFFTEKVIRNIEYGKQVLSPANSLIVTVITALVYIGGFIYAELSYFWLFASILTFFSAFIIYGQALTHSKSEGMDTELSLALQPEVLEKRIKSKRKQSIGPIVIIIVWVYAWHNVLFNT